MPDMPFFHHLGILIPIGHKQSNQYISFIKSLCGCLISTLLQNVQKIIQRRIDKPKRLLRLGNTQRIVRVPVLSARSIEPQGGCRADGSPWSCGTVAALMWPLERRRRRQLWKEEQGLVGYRGWVKVPRGGRITEVEASWPCRNRGRAWLVVSVHVDVGPGLQCLCTCLSLHISTAGRPFSAAVGITQLEC